MSDGATTPPESHDKRANPDSQPVPFKPESGAADSEFKIGDSAQIRKVRDLLDSIPEQIGHYRVLERIGGGGMGEVLRAEQRFPIRREVAIKLIKLGMDTKLVIARFEAERQALAMMDHPHIAKVFDASADETGRPYFVMEYVKGKPITEYADTNHLTINERLELFKQVCHAIQHAHHKGIIHRDLKPTNVLVCTQDGRPFAKVIDFGIAKATSHRLTDRTLYTQHEQFIGTPQYMSPEQADGSIDIDTRTDVYSLGVLLYELLTGSTPFASDELKKAAFDEIKKMIRNVDPPKPSTRLSMSAQTLPSLAASRRMDPKKLNSQVRGELDWIVMKALEKDRARRYDTPTGLLQDLTRFLEGTPVLAAPPSWNYRASKFIRKYRIPITAITCLFLALTAGIIGTTYGMRKAILARQAEEARYAMEQRTAAQAAAAKDANDLEEYIANLAFAQSAIQAQNWQEAHSRIDACVPSKRGWEWEFLTKEARQFQSRLNIPRYEALSLSRDGSVLYVIHPRDSHDGKQMATVWDVERNQPRCPPLVHDSAIIPNRGWSENGLKLLTFEGKDKSPYKDRLWDTLTGKQLASITHSHEHAALLSPDGRRAWRQCSGNGDLWDMESPTEKQLGQTLHVGETDSGSFATWNAEFTRDSKTLNVVMPASVYLISAETGRQIGKIDVGTSPRNVAFSKDGRLLIVLTDKTAQAYDSQTAKPVGAPMVHPEAIQSFRIGSDSTRMYSTTKSGAFVWELGADAHIIHAIDLTEFVPISDSIQSNFSDDGSRLVVALDDREAILIDPVSKTILGNRLEYKGDVPTFDKNGEFVLAMDADGALRVWDTMGRLVSIVRTAPGEGGNVPYFLDNGAHSISPDRRMWIASRGAVSCVQIGGPDSPREIIDPQIAAELFPEAAKEAGTGKPSATIGPDGIVRVILENGNIKTIPALRTPAVACAVTNDSRRLAIADNESIHFWDLVSSRELTSCKTVVSGIENIRFSEDGRRLLIYSTMKRVEVWDIRPDSVRQQDRATRFSEMNAARKLVNDQLQVDQPLDTIRELITTDTNMPSLRKSFAMQELEWHRGPLMNKVNAYIAELVAGKYYFSEVLARPDFIKERRLRAELLRRIASLRLTHGTTWDRVIANDLPKSEYAFYANKLKDSYKDEVAFHHNLNSMSYALYRSGDYARCIATLMTREAIDPGNNDTPAGQRRHVADWAFLAMAHFQLGNLTEAREALSSFRKFYGDGDEQHKTRYKLLAIEAISMIEPDTLEAFSPLPADLNKIAYQTCNWPDRGKPDYENSVRLATLALKLEPESPANLNTLAIALFRVGQYEKSLQSFDTVEKLYVKGNLPFPSNYHWPFRAMVAYRAGKIEDAQKYLKKILAQQNPPTMGLVASLRDEAMQLIDPQRQIAADPDETTDPTTMPSTQPSTQPGN